MICVLITCMTYAMGHLCRNASAEVVIIWQKCWCWSYAIVVWSKYFKSDILASSAAFSRVVLISLRHLFSSGFALLQRLFDGIVCSLIDGCFFFTWSMVSIRSRLVPNLLLEMSPATISLISFTLWEYVHLAIVSTNYAILPTWKEDKSPSLLRCLWILSKSGISLSDW